MVWRPTLLLKQGNRLTSIVRLDEAERLQVGVIIPAGMWYIKRKYATRYPATRQGTAKRNKTWWTDLGVSGFSVPHISSNILIPRLEHKAMCNITRRHNSRFIIYWLGVHKTLSLWQSIRTNSYSTKLKRRKKWLAYDMQQKRQRTVWLESQNEYVNTPLFVDVQQNEVTGFWRPHLWRLAARNQKVDAIGCAAWQHEVERTACLGFSLHHLELWSE